MEKPCLLPCNHWDRKLQWPKMPKWLVCLTLYLSPHTGSAGDRAGGRQLPHSCPCSCRTPAPLPPRPGALGPGLSGVENSESSVKGLTFCQRPVSSYPLRACSSWYSSERCHPWRGRGSWCPAGRQGFPSRLLSWHLRLLGYGWREVIPSTSFSHWEMGVRRELIISKFPPGSKYLSLPPGYPYTDTHRSP